MAGQERRISDGLPDAVDAWDRGLETRQSVAYTEDFMLAGSVLSRMAVTSVSSGEPSFDYTVRDKFNVSEFTPQVSIGRPHAGEYDFRREVL